MREVGGFIEEAQPFLEGYKMHNDTLLRMLGAKDPQRYIVFNQNRDEIRTNGGFPGSIITFTLYKGNILDYRTDDVYYYDWNLYPYKEPPPPGIALLTNNYGLRDVTYYPDFRMTLEKANSFVERSGDPTLTTGIALHQGLIEDILKIIGPVEVPGVNIAFDERNFSLLMSVLVENKFAREKTPKDILFAFIDSFGKKAVASKKYREIAHTLRDAWESGEVLIASRDDRVEEFLKKIRTPLPWEGEAKNWIYPVFTSVSGNKSDRYIRRSLQAETRHIDACTYENTITLKLSHIYTDQDRALLQRIMDTFGLTNGEERRKMMFIQGDGKNRSYVRYFLPLEAELIGSGATIETDEVTQTQVVAFQLDTDVGATTAKTLRYTLPIPHCSEYRGDIAIIRQP